MDGRSKLSIKKKKKKKQVDQTDDDGRVGLFDDGGEFVDQHPEGFKGEIPYYVRVEPNEINKPLLRNEKKDGDDDPMRSDITYLAPALNNDHMSILYRGRPLENTQKGEKQIPQKRQETLQPQVVVLETFESPSSSIPPSSEAAPDHLLELQQENPQEISQDVSDQDAVKNF
jgi:hypothetical protein